MPSAFSIPRIYEQEIAAAIDAGYYSNKSEVVRDALRCLFDSRTPMRIGAAIEMYKKEEVTLGKAAEIAGVGLFEFKEVLKDRGIKILLPRLSKEQIRKGTAVIKRLRTR